MTTPMGWHPVRVLGAVAGLLGVLLIAGGLVLGLSGVNRLGVNCGSALRGASDDAAVQEYANALLGEGASTVYSRECSSALSDRKTITWAVLVPGLILLFAGGAAEAAARANRGR